MRDSLPRTYVAEFYGTGWSWAWFTYGRSNFCHIFYSMIWAHMNCAMYNCQKSLSLMTFSRADLPACSIWLISICWNQVNEHTRYVFKMSRLLWTFTSEQFPLVKNEYFVIQQAKWMFFGIFFSSLFFRNHIDCTNDTIKVEHNLYFLIYGFGSLSTHLQP